MSNDTDVLYYKRRVVRDAERRRRIDALIEDTPRRIAILDRVRAGEITMAEGQRLIRSKRGDVTKAAWEGR